MRHALLGGFMGLLLAALVLAACGSSGGSVDTSANLDELTAQVLALQGELEQTRGDLAQVQDLLVHFARLGNDIYIQGANLHIDNGTGSTGGTPNGLGNLIVGYNEMRPSDNDRSGSHMLVLGTRNNYSHFGGLVAGSGSEAAADLGSILGGQGNRVTGTAATVAGGRNNTVDGATSCISGGYGNVVYGYQSVVSGGTGNVVSGSDSVIGGGRNNTLSGDYSTIGGGASVNVSAWHAFPSTHTP